MLKESKGIRLEHISKIYQDPKQEKTLKLWMMPIW